MGLLTKLLMEKTQRKIQLTDDQVLTCKETKKQESDHKRRNLGSCYLDVQSITLKTRLFNIRLCVELLHHVTVESCISVVYIARKWNFRNFRYLFPWIRREQRTEELLCYSLRHGSGVAKMKISEPRQWGISPLACWSAVQINSCSVGMSLLLIDFHEC